MEPILMSCDNLFLLIARRKRSETPLLTDPAPPLERSASRARAGNYLMGLYVRLPVA